MARLGTYIVYIHDVHRCVDEEGNVTRLGTYIYIVYIHDVHRCVNEEGNVARGTYVYIHDVYIECVVGNMARKFVSSKLEQSMHES